MNISKIINQASLQLKAYDAYQLEAELLLCHVLSKDRSYLFAYPEKILSSDQIAQFQALVHRRMAGEPMAYLLGEKEFWSLTLHVTEDTLIPRPETELLVEKVLEKLPQKEFQRVADLGTGTGAIAIAIASERPNWQIHATDISDKAIEVALKNAKRHEIHNICFIKGVWCDALSEEKYNAIVSNPPYIDPNDTHLTKGDVRFEPKGALVSDEHGLKDLKMIVHQAKFDLSPGGWLLLEHGYDQGKAVREMLLATGYQNVETYLDLAGQERVTVGMVL